MANPNDSVRRAILRYLHEIYLDRSGTHRTETQGERLSADIQKRTGMVKVLISANINYLVDRGFITHRRGTHYSSDGGQLEDQHLYGIAGPGIEHIERGYEFAANIEHQELHAILAEIRKAIDSALGLDDEDARRDAVGDIDTVQAQLRKARPDELIIGTAWKGIELSATAAEAGGLLKKAALLLFPLSR